MIAFLYHFKFVLNTSARRALPAATWLTVGRQRQVRMHLGLGAGLGSQLFVAWGSKN